MLTPILSSKFKKDIRRMKRRGKDMNKLRVLLELLVNETPLPEAYQAHPLKGSWLPFWDAHLEPDWLLIYLQKDGELLLARTGTHANIFSS
ncbi:type II toxin-antitoxin system YafQ family toxin [Desulfonatronospira sp.]|uniref:type II toxin-antitoxin system YafQ family toxin n=1 Tax=Desulfonatronospira sp. TaxID=1962951 RepID=UPI0025BE8F5A|nr:type II toxin-antitoxin system YafQ family toxin [Desulfonatronospira sp.]